jgi:hypothetical protein
MPPNKNGIIIIPPIPMPIPPQRPLPRALPLPISIGSMKIKRIGKNESPELLLLGSCTLVGAPETVIPAFFAILFMIAAEPW